MRMGYPTGAIRRPFVRAPFSSGLPVIVVDVHQFDEPARGISRQPAEFSEISSLSNAMSDGWQPRFVTVSKWRRSVNKSGGVKVFVPRLYAGEITRLGASKERR